MLVASSLEYVCPEDSLSANALERISVTLINRGIARARQQQELSGLFKGFDCFNLKFEKSKVRVAPTLAIEVWLHLDLGPFLGKILFGIDRLICGG